MNNPFNPAPGALPSRIVGREPELSAMREALRRVRVGSAPTPLVFIGQRGMGKTVLLRELRDLAGKDALAVPLEIIARQALAETLRDKLDDIVGSVESLPTKAAHSLDRAIKALPKLSYELPHNAGAISLGHEEQEQAHRQSLTAMLKALVLAARSAKRFVVITIDEFQDADVRSMETLVRFVHESAQGAAPVLLACAGLSESRELLERLRTYVQRWTSFELRLLTESETVEAIREPIVATGTAIDEDALDLLVRESAGYPFFIQTYASAAWERHKAPVLTLDDVETSLPAARTRNEIAFYVRPLARMSPRESVFALELADLGPGAHEIGKVARALGLTAPDVSSIRATLAKKAIIDVPIPGKVEFRIPFTDRYLRDHREEYETPEVASYRQRIVRRIGSPPTDAS